MNSLLITRFNGAERYLIESAKCFTVDEDEGITLWFEIETGERVESTCGDTKEFPGSPSAELGIALPSIDLKKLGGRKFQHAGTANNDEDSCESLFYYFEHQPLRDNEVEVLSQPADDKIRIRWTGRTQDVNFYDGSKPDARIEVECDIDGL